MAMLLPYSTIQNRMHFVIECNVNSHLTLMQQCLPPQCKRELKDLLKKQSLSSVCIDVRRVKSEAVKLNVKSTSTNYYYNMNTFIVALVNL